MEIIPSIIAENFEELETKLSRLAGLVAWAEIDVLDGAFVPTISWQNEKDLKKIDGQTKLSVHLMTEMPETLAEDWREFVDRIIFHFEATTEVEKIVNIFTGYPTQVGLALELNTPLEKIYRYLNKIKIVQLMSINNLGYQGEKFDERVLEKIETLRADWPDVKIIVDGGINLITGKKAKEAGADTLVVGSQIWQAENFEENIKKFQAL